MKRSRMDNIFGVILAGGKGERFWPMSRIKKPKQLLPIISKKTMLEETVLRLEHFIKNDDIYVIATEQIRKPIIDLNCLKTKNVFAEPFGRNTALAIGYAAIKMNHINPNSIMLVCPADHDIKTVSQFEKTIELGYKYALQGNLVTFGITPVRPDIGYGYIEIREALQDEKVYKINTFKEKPNLKVATSYLKGKKTLWNSGIFLWKTEEILKSIEKHIPDMYNNLVEFEDHIGTDNESKALLALYKKCKSTSIDFGVLEQADNIVIVRAQFEWDDVGNWNALERTMNVDDKGNTCSGEVETLNANNNVVYSEKGLIAVLGVDDLVIVKTDDVTYVCSKRDTASIKSLIEKIGKNDKLKKYL